MRPTNDLFMYIFMHLRKLWKGHGKGTYTPPKTQANEICKMPDYKSPHPSSKNPIHLPNQSSQNMGQWIFRRSYTYFPTSATKSTLPFFMSYHTIHPLTLPLTPQPARCPIWSPHLWALHLTNLRQNPARHKRSLAGPRLRINAACPQRIRNRKLPGSQTSKKRCTYC